MDRCRMRNAIAMIELIFALVVMGIALMSAPMLMNQASKSAIFSIQQEAIAVGASEMGMILSHHWDESDTNESLANPVLVTQGNDALKEAADNDGNSTGRRAGTPPLSTRSFITETGKLNASPIGQDGGDLDDIDDYNGYLDTLTDQSTGGTTPTTEEGDYVDKSMQVTASVTYLSDTPSSGSYNAGSLNLNAPFSNVVTANTTNIKAVSVHVASGSHNTELDTDITLRAFSCNIGGYMLQERSF